jgi:hypothetical protein
MLKTMEKLVDEILGVASAASIPIFLPIREVH